MRTATLILATLLLAGSTLLGFLGTNRSLKDAKAIDEAKQSIALVASTGGKQAAELKSLSEKTGRLRAGGVAMALVGLFSLAVLATMFTKKNLVPHAAIGLVAAALAAIVISPQYDLGPLAPASARSLAYVIGVIAVLGATTAYGAKAMGSPRQARAIA